MHVAMIELIAIRLYAIGHTQSPFLNALTASSKLRTRRWKKSIKS